MGILVSTKVSWDAPEDLGHSRTHWELMEVDEDAEMQLRL